MGASVPVGMKSIRKVSQTKVGNQRENADGMRVDHRNLKEIDSRIRNVRKIGTLIHADLDASGSGQCISVDKRR